MDRHSGIAEYLKFVAENYRLTIVINDFVGFLNVDKNLKDVLQPYLIHKNPYCMHIKSDKKLWDRCICMKRNILIKSEKLKDAFYGMCYCGVEEFIIPIICKDVVIGVISAGEFSRDKNTSNYRIKKVAHENGLDYNELKDKFAALVENPVPDINSIKSILCILSDYIALFYSSFGLLHKDMNLVQIKNHSTETYILSHAIEFIKQNYSEKIGVKEIANFCHCSESYMNHIFKKNMKVNIKLYINKIRIEQAKNYLLDGKDSISDIAMKTGFCDPNYFSNTFRKIMGISPTDFKKRFRSRTLTQGFEKPL